MNRSRPVIACVLVVLAFAAQRPVSAAEQSSDSNAAWMAEHYTKYEHLIPMRDGVRLFTRVYIPKDDSEAWPIILAKSSTMTQGEPRIAEDRLRV